MLPQILWAYRTTKQSSTCETPFSVVYGHEEMVPVEMEVGTSRTLGFVSHEENQEKLSTELDMVDEDRIQGQLRDVNRKKIVSRAIKKHVKQISFDKGDLVLRKIQKHVGKLEPNWEGPYKVNQVLGKEAYVLKDCKEGFILTRP